MRFNICATSTRELANMWGDSPICHRTGNDTSLFHLRKNKPFVKTFQTTNQGEKHLLTLNVGRYCSDTSVTLLAQAVKRFVQMDVHMVCKYFVGNNASI